MRSHRPNTRPTAACLGIGQLDEFLAGACELDQHFLHAPLERNIPVVLALLGIWYVNFFGAETYAIFSYARALSLFPSHMQQVHMTSSGKRITRLGEVTNYATAPIVWGATGTDCQYTVMEMLYRGSRLIPCDFIAVVNSRREFADIDSRFVANCLAQSELLMDGRSQREVMQELREQGLDESHVRLLTPEMAFPGNQPSNTIMLESLDARSLGALLACYEHKVAVQRLIWDF